MPSAPQLEVTRYAVDEIAHYYDSSTGDLIASTGNVFRAELQGRTYRFTVPLHMKYGLARRVRLSRRLLRLDKSNAVFNHARDGIVVLYRGLIYFFDLNTEQLREVGRLKQCRNVLHCGIAVTSEHIVLGEYGVNPERDAVPVWQSSDDGRSWSVVHEFEAGAIRHIHGIYTDPHSDSLWIPTGDFSGECYVFEVRDSAFNEVVRHGNGEQRWRPVSMFFDPDKIVWAMDSELQTSCLQVFDRASGELQEMRGFEGPVWFSKRFEDGSAVLQTTVEVGEGVKSNCSHLHYSEDLINWVEVARYPKDRWPMPYFKSGVIAFAAGPQTRDDFVFFGEALSGIDGRVAHGRIAL
ncbi:MAG: hypothetical protein AAGA11_21945 [Pseudomonadota bacterium]